MDNQHLANCKDTFLKIAEESIRIGKKYENDLPDIKSHMDHFEAILNERLNDFNPKIMVYGIYNSGKSTIMNALMGQKTAAMSDVPTTFRIDQYRWKEYTIYDTPGINAPKKDEEVSKAQLEKCDVILFVMDTEGAFNLGKNYRELFDILRSGKRLLIVLNNKSGYDPVEDAGEIQKIERNIYKDFAELYKSATPEELADKVKIILVNALDALNARTDPQYSDEERKILLEGSNIEALENAIISEYGKASGFTIIHELEIQLRDELDRLTARLKNISGDEMTSKGKQSLCELQDLQDRLLANITDYANDIADELDGDIYHILTSVDNEDDARDKIQKAADDWFRRVVSHMEKQIKNVSVRVDNVLSDFSDFMKIQVGDVHLPAAAEGEMTPNAIARLDDVGGQSSDKTLSIAEGYLLQSGVKALLPTITKLPVVGAMLGKILGPLVPVIGPIIAIASVLIPLFGESDSEKRYKAELAAAQQRAEAERRQQEEIARRKQEVKDESRRISRKISSGIMDQIQKMVFKCFEPSFKMIQDSIASHRKHSSDILADLRKVDDLKQMLQEKVMVYCNR